MNDREESIYHVAREKASPEERANYLKQACGDDAGLRKRLQSLLEADANPISLFGKPGFSAFANEASGVDVVGSKSRDRLSPPSLDGGTLGDFRIIREIGRGGMGVVYEAEQISLGRRVALKVLPFAAVLDQRQLQRFTTEAKAAAGLHHGNIVPVHHFGSERAVHFYAMQFIEGQDVAELIGQFRQFADLDGGELPRTKLADFELASSIVSGQFAPPEPTRRLAPLAVAVAEDSGDRSADVAAKTAGDTRPMAELSTKGSTSKPEYFRTIAGLGIQAAEALQFAHGRGILHRDIKPSNLMLDGDGKLWITDFGLARVEGDAGLTMTGDVMGTLRYMSPEQALGQRDVVDGRSDVYSLGVTLYEMLTLTPIYPTTDRNELLQKRAQEEPAPLRQVNRDVPVDLETIVLKAIAKEPGDRYATAQEFADDLRRFLNHEPIRAKRPSAVNRLGKWVQRHKSLAALFAVLMLGGPLAGYGVMALLTKEAPAGLGQGQSKSVQLSAAVAKPSLAPAKGDFLPGLVPEPTSIADIGRWQVTTKKPRGVLKSGVWSPDEKLIAVGEAGNVRIYDADNLRLLSVLVGHSQHVTSIDWHPQGERLASASWDGTVRLWTVDGVPTHEFTGHSSEVYQVQWHPDGEQLASCGADGTVRLWNPNEDTSRVLESHRNHVFCLDWSPDGNLLASAGGQMGPPAAEGETGDNAIRVWDVANSELRAKFEGHEYSVLALDWHPDGQQLAAGDGSMFRLGLGWKVNPKGTGVRIWNLDGTAGPVLDDGYGSIYAVAWNPAGTHLASGGRQGVVHVWDAAKKTTTNITPDDTTGSRLDLYSIDWKSDGQQLLTTSRAALRQLDKDGTQTSVLRPLPSRSFVYVGWSPDGRQISTGGNIWQADGTPVENKDIDSEWTKFVNRNTDRHPGDGRIAKHNGMTLEVRAAAGEFDWSFSLENEPTPGFRAVRWSPDGQRLAAASYVDRTIRIWRENGELINEITGHRGGVESVAWSPDGKFLASAGGATVRIWTPDGQPLHVLHGHRDEVYDVAWSPDGKLLASAGTDAIIRLWTADGNHEKTLTGHHAGIHALAWSPDGKNIASASWLDSTLRMWDVASGETTWQVLRLTNDETITLSPSGMVLNGDRNLKELSLLYLIEKHDSSLRVSDFEDFHQKYAGLLMKQYGMQIQTMIQQNESSRVEAAYRDLLSFQNINNPEDRKELLLIVHNQVGSAYSARKEYAKALNVFSDAVKIGEKLTEEHPGNTEYRGYYIGDLLA